MNLFELTLKMNGFPVGEAREELLKIQAISNNDYASHIDLKKEELIDFHYSQNSFYKEFIGDEKIRSWTDVPVMTKADLQRPLKERLSKGYSEKTVYVNKTSGSSGHPFIFAKDKFCHALTWVRVMDLYKKQSIDLGSSLEARFYGIPLDTFGYQKERLKDRLGSRHRFPIFDLSEEKMEQFLKTFRRKKFDYINGYTSSIVLFAKFLSSKNTILTTICPTLKKCIVTSEMLFESDQKLLEQWLGVPIINEYGASELGVMGFTNTEDRFSLNTETLYIEILDDYNNPVPPGTSGKIVVTGLYNKAHPMIRYEIGDFGILSSGGSSKDQAIEKLIGRTNDVAVLKGGKQVPGLTFYYVTKSVIEEDGNVKEFIVEQNDLETFTIVYVSEKELTSTDFEKIQKALETYVGGDLQIVFKKVEVLNRTKRGKLKQFIKLF